MKDLFQQKLSGMSKELGGKVIKVPRLHKKLLKWPFSEVSYEAECTQGHLIELSTGNCVFAPDSWEQWGWCLGCGKYYHRVIARVTTKEGKHHFAYSEMKEGLN